MNSIYDELSRYSPDGLIHDNERLAELQALPLHQKIGITIARITEWYNAFNGKIFISLSGGKDSTVLWDITHKLFPDVPGVFSNTGLEYPEIQSFAKSICTDVVSPKMSFVDVIKTFGYPLISKEVSEAIYYARRNTPPKPRNGVEETGADRGQTSNQQTRLLGKKTTIISPPRRTHNISETIRATRAKERSMSSKRTFGERCLWVAILQRTAIRSQPLIKKSGCLLSIFRLRFRTIAAT